MQENVADTVFSYFAIKFKVIGSDFLSNLKSYDIIIKDENILLLDAASKIQKDTLIERREDNKTVLLKITEVLPDLYPYKVIVEDKTFVKNCKMCSYKKP